VGTFLGSLEYIGVLFLRKEEITEVGVGQLAVSSQLGYKSESSSFLQKAMRKVL
jgi:hypothetical protein